jgi:hypothetical protein
MSAKILKWKDDQIPSINKWLLLVRLRRTVWGVFELAINISPRWGFLL